MHHMQFFGLLAPPDLYGRNCKRFIYFLQIILQFININTVVLNVALIYGRNVEVHLIMQGVIFLNSASIFRQRNVCDSSLRLPNDPLDGTSW